MMSRMLPCGLPPMAKGSLVTIFVTLTFLSASGSKSSTISHVVEAFMVDDARHLVQVVWREVGEAVRLVSRVVVPEVNVA